MRSSMKVGILSRMIRGGLSEKMAFEQKTVEIPAGREF